MKDILVSIDSTNGFADSLKAAVHIADKFDSYITGVYQEHVYGYSSYAEVYSDIVTKGIEKQLEQEKQAVANMFNNCVTPRAHKSTIKFEPPLGPNTILSHAHLSDIVMCAQPNSETMRFGTSNQPEHLLMGSGKPVLIIPYIGFQETIGKNIMIAWDGSREASRAVHDAIPFLERADEVHIFSAINKTPADNDMAAPEHLVNHLEHHGVKSQSNLSSLDDISVAASLLSRASDYGTDLLVMGAYGHSRLREYTLGGTTRDILNSMTVPVLMTH